MKPVTSSTISPAITELFRRGANSRNSVSSPVPTNKTRSSSQQYGSMESYPLHTYRRHSAANTLPFSSRASDTKESRHFFLEEDKKNSIRNRNGDATPAFYVVPGRSYSCSMMKPGKMDVHKHRNPHKMDGHKHKYHHKMDVHRHRNPYQMDVCKHKNPHKMDVHRHRNPHKKREEHAVSDPSQEMVKIEKNKKRKRKDRCRIFVGLEFPVEKLFSAPFVDKKFRESALRITSKESIGPSGDYDKATVESYPSPPEEKVLDSAKNSHTPTKTMEFPLTDYFKSIKHPYTQTEATGYPGQQQHQKKQHTKPTMAQKKQQQQQQERCLVPVPHLSLKDRVEDYLRKLDSLHQQKMAAIEDTEDPMFTRSHRRHFPLSKENSTFIYKSRPSDRKNGNKMPCDDVLVSDEGIRLGKRKIFPNKNVTAIELV